MRDYKKTALDQGLCASGCGAPLHVSNKNYCLEHAAERGRRYSHGLGLDGRLILYARQSGTCAICGIEEADPMKLAVDHDHSTGHPRGLLCRLCNTGLGSFGDSVTRLEAAQQYIEERA